ncbi:AraC family transcriptional regulator [Dyadobacter jiangsuensis]|uniref:AraC-like DNA-binding protein n=1 Tax=Dyadobacter jiangsuensis TaxID=1591085 RepID=A0A2P8FPA9_9BACT|nr:AraC family transcriptional regulator [Dyadobacter jiangsuensis]PSL23568.1 AraC-like DNA-binding protein [Dyadobacter jiangsuensis]
MRISYQNEPLFPGKPAPVFTGRALYRHYEQSEGALTEGVHWFDFQTNAAHTLNVGYEASFYKMVLCIAGESKSLPKRSREYSFRTGQAVFYRTEEEPYQAALPADTAFKVIHMHLSDTHIAMLQRDAPAVFEKELPVMNLTADCAQAFLQLKNVSRENQGLLSLFQEKLITEQLFNLASHVLPRIPRTRGEAILEEAVWHIHRAERYLTIAELSRLAGTNSFCLKQLFREQMRTSVFQYQCDLRLERAANLLVETSLDVSEVALQCGYESAAAFSNAFLRKYKVRPTAARPTAARPTAARPLTFKNSRLGK